MTQYKDSREIHVSVENEQMKQLLEQNSALQREKEALAKEVEENKDAKEKLDLIAQNAFEKIKKEPDVTEDITNPMELMAFERGKKSNVRETVHVPSGTVPLSTQQNNSNPQAFGTHEEMIDSIRDRASIQNPDKQDRKQAQAILDKLFEKSLKGQNESRKPFDYEMPKEISLSDLLSEKVS